MPAKIQRQPNQSLICAQWHAEHQRTADAHEDQADRPAALGRGGQLGGEQAGEDDQQPATGRHSQASQGAGRDSPERGRRARCWRAQFSSRVASSRRRRSMRRVSQPSSGAARGEAEGEQGGELAGQVDGDPQVFGQGRQDADQDAFRQAGGEGGQGAAVSKRRSMAAPIPGKGFRAVECLRLSLVFEVRQRTG